MGFALVHKTISFVAGAAIVGFGGLYMHDQIRFATNRVTNRIVQATSNAPTTDLVLLDEDRDYYEDAVHALRRGWNRSLNGFYKLSCNELQNDTPIRERFSNWYEKIRSKSN